MLHTHHQIGWDVWGRSNEKEREKQRKKSKESKERDRERQRQNYVERKLFYDKVGLV